MYVHCTCVNFTGCHRITFGNYCSVRQCLCELSAVGRDLIIQGYMAITQGWLPILTKYGTCTFPKQGSIVLLNAYHRLLICFENV